VPEIKLQRFLLILPAWFQNKLFTIISTSSGGQMLTQSPKNPLLTSLPVALCSTVKSDIKYQYYYHQYHSCCCCCYYYLHYCWYYYYYVTNKFNIRSFLVRI